eukprot:m.259816 g.259816  ORF g.259816 m.259816 type:complete len:246 (+) comp22983_c0_seq1:31-768(+)
MFSPGTCAKYYPQVIAVFVLVSVAFFVLMRGSQIIFEGQQAAPFAGPPWIHKDMTLENSILFHTRFMRLESHTIRAKNGEVINGWMWVDFHDQVNVLAQDSHNNFVVIRQEKYGLAKPTLSVVSGSIALNESPKEAAVRELLDELGLVAKEWVFLGKYRTDVNRGGGFVHSYLARKATPKRGQRPPTNEMEQQEVVRLSQHGLTQALLGSEFGEAKWSNTVALALIRLATPGAPTLAEDVPVNQQ